MKLKYWLVLLLALILPVKGAMAAVGMLCHVPASQQVLLVHDHASHEMHDVQASADLPDASHHHHGSGDSSGHAPDTSCLACAAVCGASPLPTALGLNLPAFDPVRDWRVFASAEPTSLSLAGLERPPRSI